MNTCIGTITVTNMEEMLEVTGGLVRRQIQFEVRRHDDDWIICLTGGF